MTDTATDKRTAILNATLELVVERGFHDTPVSQIAKRAGVSAGIIYHYFDNKDTLIQELYREVKKRFGAALLTNNMHTMPLPQKIKQLWLNAYHYYVNHPNETQFLDQYESSPYPHSYDPADYGEDMLTVLGIVQQAYDSDLMKDLPYEVLHEMTFKVAANLARRQIEGIVHLDEETLDVIAEALRGAVMR